jgi:hypothetical protein
MWIGDTYIRIPASRKHRIPDPVKKSLTGPPDAAQVGPLLYAGQQQSERDGGSGRPPGTQIRHSTAVPLQVRR